MEMVMIENGQLFIKLILAGLGAAWGIRVMARYRVDKERCHNDPAKLRSLGRRVRMVVALPALIILSWLAFIVGLPVEVTLGFGALALLDAIAVGVFIMVDK